MAEEYGAGGIDDASEVREVQDYIQKPFENVA